MSPTLSAPCGGLTAGEWLVAATDALVSGVHFPAATAPHDVAYKAFAVNLSDLAAMGARALAAQAACEAPAGDDWCARVGPALHAAADAFDLGLAVHAAPGARRRVAVQILGQVPRDAALTRDGARPGDVVWVSGTLGDAGGGLAVAEGRLDAALAADRAWLRARLDRPTPRLALGGRLRGVASAAIDLSDGLAGDAGHVASRSGVAIRLRLADLPVSPALERAVGAAAARRLALTAGDDYELMFTAPAGGDAAVRRAAARGGVAVTAVGDVTRGTGVSVKDEAGRPMISEQGYEHFRGAGDPA